MIRVYFRPDAHCPVELAVLVAATFGLLWIWVALGRGNWFFRFAVAHVATLSLLLAKAYQPYVFFTLAGVATVVPLAAARWFCDGRQLVRSTPTALKTPSGLRRWSAICFAAVVACIVAIVIWSFAQEQRLFISRSEMLLAQSLLVPTAFIAMLGIDDRIQLGRWRFESTPKTTRFSLREAMGTMLLLGITFGASSLSLAREPVAAWKSLQSVLATVSLINVLIACLLTAALTRWKVLSLLLLALVLTWATYRDGQAGGWLVETSPFGWARGNAGQAIWSIVTRTYAATLGCLVLVAVCAGFLSITTVSNLEKTTTRTAARISALILAGLLTFFVVLPIFRISWPLPAPPPYEGDSETLARICDIAADLLDVPASRPSDVRKGFDEIARLSQTPFKVDSLQSDDHQAQMILLRGLSTLGTAQTNRYFLEKKPDDAATIWLALSRLGNGVINGSDGSVGDILTGLAIESSALRSLANFRHRFSSTQLAVILAELDQHERASVATEAIRRRCDLQLEREFGWRFRFAIEAQRTLSLMPAAEHGTLATPSLQAIEDAIQRRNVTRRLLMTALAIHLHEFQEGELPRELSALAPSTLSQIPMDPWNPDATLVYRRTGDQFVLYSVGMDGIDDGGVFGTEAQSYNPGFDFDIETPMRLIPRATPTSQQQQTP